MMFLGGVFFPMETMPDFLRPIVQAIPLTYLGDSLRQIMVSPSLPGRERLGAGRLARRLSGPGHPVVPLGVNPMLATDAHLHTP